MFLIIINRGKYTYLLGLVMCFLFFSNRALSNEISEINKADLSGLKASQQSQIKVEALDDRNLDVVEQYRQVLREQQLADKYNQLLTKQIAQLEVAMGAIEAKQSQLRTTRMMLGPLMDEMVQSLTMLVEADAPFLIEERRARVANLQQRMVDASLSESDKILSILDAYQVELSYGYTTESWQGKLDGVLVTYVRVGRLGFYYFTPDEMKAGMWVQSWQPLAVDWVAPLKQAAEMSAGKQLPSLITLPPMAIETKQ